MELLSPEATKQSSSRTEREARERIQLLREEESKAVRSFNELKTRVEQESQKLERDLLLKKEEAEQRKQELICDVLSLEARRADALKPIAEMRKATEDAWHAVQTKTEELKQEKQALLKKEEEIALLLEQINDLKNQLSSREVAVQEREQMANQAERKLQYSSEVLSKKWVEFLQEKKRTFEAIALRESDIRRNSHANDVRKQSLDAEYQRLKQERRAIRDGYDSLAKARKEILGRDT